MAGEKPAERQKPSPAHESAGTAGGPQKRSEPLQKPLHPIAAARLTNRRRGR